MVRQTCKLGVDGEIRHLRGGGDWLRAHRSKGATFLITGYLTRTIESIGGPHGLEWVESANSISETAAVRSAFLCLGSPVFKRPLCRFLHCGCDDEQRLLCLDS